MRCFRITLQNAEQIKRLESLLAEATETAQKAGLSMEELQELLDLINSAE